MFAGWRPSYSSLANTSEQLWHLKCGPSHVISREEVTKSGGMNEYALLVRCRVWVLVPVCVCVCREGKVSRTCVSHFEGSLLNDLHLFSDLWTPSFPPLSCFSYAASLAACLLFPVRADAVTACVCVCVGWVLQLESSLLHYYRSRRNLNMWMKCLSFHSLVECVH